MMSLWREQSKILARIEQARVLLVNFISKRKTFFQNWLTENVIKRFDDRILPLGANVCLRWGEMQAQLEKQGKLMPAIDGLIAATALQHQLTIITRNTKDLAASGAALFNPWAAQN